MRILIINPNSDTHTDSVMAVKAKALALPDVDVDVIHMNSAPKLVCSYEEQAVSIGEMVDAVKKTEDMYDAFIIACHSDPNLDLIREITSKPVIGIAEASMKIASMMGNGFAVISPSPKSSEILSGKVHSVSFAITHFVGLLLKLIISFSPSISFYLYFLF